MANEKILNTRIQLKYDSYEHWNGSSVVLKAGEIAIAYLAPANKDNSTHASGQHPVLIKVGDGNHTFAQLPWLSALAADVYAWAKKENPDWNDFPALPIEVVDNGTGKFVTDVEYANNKITISRSDVNWTDIKNAPDFALKTEIPTDFGVLSVEAADTSLEINPTTGDVKAKAKISVAEDNILRVENDGLYVPAPAAVDTGVMSVSGKEAIKVTGDAEVEVSLALDSTGNVVLSQSDTGLKAAIDLSAYRLIADDEDTKYGLEYDSENKVIKLVEGGTDLTIDATDFIADGMLESVVANQDDNTLTFTWNTDGNKTATTVELSAIADIYTGVDGTTIKVDVSSDNKISAEVKTGSLEDGHIASNAAIAETKLAQNVQDALGLARTALQSHQDISGKADKAVPTAAGNLASLDVNGNLTDSGKKASDFALKSELPSDADYGVLSVDGDEGIEVDNTDAQNPVVKIADKGVTTAKIADKAVGAEQTKAYQASIPTKDNPGSEEVWVFYCGTSDILV